MPKTGHLVVMAKNPVPGMVKTRLIPALGPEGACALYRAMLRDVAASMAIGPWQTTIAVHPPESKTDIASILPAQVDVIAQLGSDLTDRMIQVFDALLSQGGPVIMRNSDSPDLPRSTVEAAFALLDSDTSDVVFGPDCGGGYYLVGLKKPCPELFRTEMSTADNFEKTLERCQSLGLQVAMLHEFSDIDTPTDLEALVHRSADIQSTCPKTWAALLALGLVQ